MLTPPLNLRHLIAALEVRNCGTIMAASEHVHLSQSAITQGLRKLETSLGFNLFDRNYDGLTPTAVGEIFLGRVEVAIQYLKNINRVLPPVRPSQSHAVHRSLTMGQLRAFLAVVEHGSYTVAAGRMNLSEPTVHRAVQTAQTVCGFKFFRKSPAGLEPVWHTREMARLVALFFSELNQATDAVNEHQGQMSSALNIGSLPLARSRMIPQAVISLLTEYPDARVSITDGPYSEQLSSLLHGRLDLIVGALRDEPADVGISQHGLFEDPLKIVVRPGHKLEKRRKISAKELRKIEWVAPREGTPARTLFTEFFRRNGLHPPERVVECSSLIATRGLLMESDRAALLSEKQVAVDVAANLLAICDRGLEGTNRVIGITSREHWLPTAMQKRFVEILEQQN